MNRFALIALLAAACASAPALARDWTMRDGSKLGFTGSWEGAEFDGVFHKFAAAISFDPKDLATSRFDVKVDVTSADTQSSDRDEALADPEWFNFAKFPQAHFQTTGFKALEAGRFDVSGTLTIKDVSKPISFPIEWHEQGGSATLRGETTLLRTDFHIGEGEWAADETIGFKVRVRFELKLEAAAGGG
jgi:polyisoprenoid-binding protein YceI